MTTEISTIQENDLNLRVSEKKLGELKTNATQIKALVEQSIHKYDVNNYSEENIAKARADRAVLNGAATKLNAKRIEIEREFMAPFAEFKAIVSETISLIGSAITKIDAVINGAEEKERAQKRGLISEYFDSKGFRIVPLSRIFNARWLNKTMKLSEIYKEIDDTIKKIESDLETLKTIEGDDMLIQTVYLETFSLNAAIQHAEKLKKNRERLESMNAQRETPPAASGIPQASQPTRRDAAKEEQAPSQEETIYIRTFRVKTTREKIIALGNFMNENSIPFEKIELTNN